MIERGHVSVLLMMDFIAACWYSGRFDELCNLKNVAYCTFLISQRYEFILHIEGLAFVCQGRLFILHQTFVLAATKRSWKLNTVLQQKVLAIDIPVEVFFTDSEIQFSQQNEEFLFNHFFLKFLFKAFNNKLIPYKLSIHDSYFNISICAFSH